MDEKVARIMGLVKSKASRRVKCCYGCINIFYSAGEVWECSAKYGKERKIEKVYVDNCPDWQEGKKRNCRNCGHGSLGANSAIHCDCGKGRASRPPYPMCGCSEWTEKIWPNVEVV